MRNVFLVTLVGFLATALNCTVCFSGTDAEKGKEAVMRAKPTYRVLYNQDCSHFFDRGGNTPEGVQRMVDEVADGGADVFLVNVNAQLVNYPSKVWQTMWDGYKEGDRSFFGGVADEGIARREHCLKNAMILAEKCDYVATALSRCREKGIAPGITLRMNDMHDAPWPTSHAFSRFWKENPQFRLAHWRGRGWGSAGWDYAHAEVREHLLSLIRELAQGYDFDVLELDFLRFPYYFSRDDIDRHCETMTGFIRDVREILDATGRSIALIPRVASSPGAARQLGFDVQAWARAGLVDGITAGNFLGGVWDVPIAEFRELVGPEVAVYASMELAADRRDGLRTRYTPESYEMLRGFAAGYLASGADGINTFNYFLAENHHPVTAEEYYGGLREMLSLEEARNKPRTHVLTASYWLVECDMPEQVPAVVRKDKSRPFYMLLAAEGAGQEVQALVTYDGEAQAEDLWLRIGLYSAGRAVEVREGPEIDKGKETARKSKIAVFNVPAGAIKDGKNELVIRSEKTDTRVLGIDVNMKAAQAAGNSPEEMRALFAGSDCIVDERGREILESGSEGLEAIANLKRFTLAHGDLVIQHHFAGDALSGLSRTLVYTGHKAGGDTFGSAYEGLAARQEAIERDVMEISEQYERVFPFVVSPPRNRPTHDMEYFRKHYQGGTDFAEITGAMLSRANDLLASSADVEKSAREQLKALGAGGGADWAPGCDLRTQVGSSHKQVNFDADGRPTNIIVGNALTPIHESNTKPNGDLLQKFSIDYRQQQNMANQMDENGDIMNAGRRFGQDNLPGEVIVPCSVHGGTMHCVRPLFDLFQREGRLKELFAGPGNYGPRDYTASYEAAGGWVPVDWTLPEVQEAHRDYLMKLGALYADRPDINFVKIAWEPTNAWGSAIDPDSPDKGKYKREGGHSPSGVAAFHRRMEEKFGSIEELNRAWKSSYKSFEEIDVSGFYFHRFPSERTGASPLFYEWQTHRKAMMAEWWKLCYDALREGGLRRPVAVDLAGLPEVIRGLEPYLLAAGTDIIAGHSGSTPTHLDILLESLEHYYPGKALASDEWCWNDPEGWIGATDATVAGAGRRNLWRAVAHGKTIFGIYGSFDTYQPYPAWRPVAGNNMFDYWTDYTLARPAAGALQMTHVKVDALKDVWLDTRPAPGRIGVYWPTASTINALPLDVVTETHDKRGIIETMNDMLGDRGYRYRFVFEQAVLDGKEDLSGVSVLIMPYAAWLPEEVSALVPSWVRSGGTLIAAGPFAAETPYGFEDGKAMREIFGGDFAMEHADGVQWAVSSSARYQDHDVLEAACGRGRVLLTASGFGLFSGKGNSLFWQVLDSSHVRDAWCVADGREPKVDIALRQDAAGTRYLSVTNQDARAPVEMTLGIKGRCGEVVDMGVCGSVSFQPTIDGANSYVDLVLGPGEATVYKLGKAPVSTPGLDTEAMRTEVQRLAKAEGAPVGKIDTLDRRGLAELYNKLLGRPPIAAFEPVKPGDVVVRAPFTNDMKLAAMDGENPYLAAPDGVFGKARVENGALVLDEPGSGICYIGEGYQGETWGGSLGSIVGKPFTLEMEFKANSEDSAGTLVHIWYDYRNTFRIGLVKGGGLQIRQEKFDKPLRTLTTKNLGLCDGDWHHIGLTVPNVSDEAQEMVITVDGKPVCRENDPDTHGKEYVFNRQAVNMPDANPGRPIILGMVSSWSLGCATDTTSTTPSVYADPAWWDTATGSYRNLLVTQGTRRF